MRLTGSTRLACLVGVTAAIVAAVPSAALADKGGRVDTSASGRTISATVQVAGFYPDAPPSQGASCPDDLVRTTNPTGLTRVVGGVEQTQYMTGCFLATDSGGLNVGGVDVVLFWSAPPSPQSLIPNLFQIVEEQVAEPEVEWPNMNRENGWLFVNVPHEFRVLNVEEVSADATASNWLGSASASVTATPTELTFVSGEGGTTTCAIEDARLGYVPREPQGGCIYTYENSSAVAPDGWAWPASMTATFEISSSPANSSLPATLETTTEFGLPVSEVQAVVTCVGGTGDC